MSVRVIDGWLCVPYAGPELAPAYIAVGSQRDWRPAFLDWNGPARVAKVRVPAGQRGALSVWLRVGDVITSQGKVVL